jgi:hypothetical protein
MATIVIQDLTENTELDRQAMLAIAGGSRFRSGASAATHAAARRIRLFDLGAGKAARPAVARPPSR